MPPSLLHKLGPKERTLRLTAKDGLPELTDPPLPLSGRCLREQCLLATMDHWLVLLIAVHLAPATFIPQRARITAELAIPPPPLCILQQVHPTPPSRLDIPRRRRVIRQHRQVTLRRPRRTARRARVILQRVPATRLLLLDIPRRRQVTLRRLHHTARRVQVTHQQVQAIHRRARVIRLLRPLETRTPRPARDTPQPLRVTRRRVQVIPHLPQLTLPRRRSTLLPVRSTRHLVHSTVRPAQV